MLHYFSVQPKVMLEILTLLQVVVEVVEVVVEQVFLVRGQGS